MLTWNFLTKSIFLSHQHYLIRASERLRIVYHPSQSFWKAEEGGKKRRNFRWSHVRLDSCAAHFRMEQAHLFSCWLPALKSPEDGSTVRTHACSECFLLQGFALHVSLFHPPWQKMTNTFLCSRRASLHLSNRGRKSDSGTRRRLQGDFWSSQTATYEWIQMESCGEGIMY